MRLWFTAIVATIGMFVVSCSTTSIDPMQSDASSKGAGTTLANEVTHEAWEQPIEIYNVCNGEWITGDVSIKVVSSMKTKSNGTTQIRITYNVSGVLYDEAGNKYIWRDNTFYHEQDTEGSCPYVGTGVGTIRLMTPGGKNNMNLNIDYKYTIDCDWNYISEYDNFSTTCE